MWVKFSKPRAVLEAPPPAALTDGKTGLRASTF
jgi:hypothetical protein